MEHGLSFAKRRLINTIVKEHWGIEPGEKKFDFNELLFVVQELLSNEGKLYLEEGHFSINRGHHVFREFVKLLLYRNLANFDSMILITSEKGTGKSSAAIMLARQWCKLIGIRFDPKRHIAYNNADVMNKIDSLNKFEPIICLPGNTYVRIRRKKKEYNITIASLVGKNDFEVLTYNIKKDCFEWKKPEKVILTKEEKVDTIELENGIRIQATSNHLFLTKSGEYKKVSDLTENDELVLNTKKCVICGTEFFNSLQYATTCSRKCSKENGRRIKYNERYPEKSKAWYKKYWKHKFYSDINFRIKHNVSTRIAGALRNYNENYNTQSKFLKLLGCNYKQLREHLEKQFREGMSWENYGVLWSVDHKKGVCTFNLANEDEKKECFHHSNLQPLLCKENSSKGTLDKMVKQGVAKYDYE